MDIRARVTTTKAVNPELLTKLLGAAVSTSGVGYDKDDVETLIVAEPPVTQEQLERVIEEYQHDPDYSGADDPDYPMKPMEEV